MDNTKSFHSNEDESKEEFFQTAINETMKNKPARKNEEVSISKTTEDRENSRQLMPGSIEQQMKRLLPAHCQEIPQIGRNNKPMSPVYFSRSKRVEVKVEEKESTKTESDVDLSKLFSMKKIAKGLVSMQKTRQQRLEDTGNVTIHRKLRNFEPDVVHERVRRILERNLRKVKYEPILCRKLSKSLSELVRDEVKSMHYPRYRFISLVSIGQLDTASVLLGSRCSWNTDTDNFASSTFSNGSLYAVAQVFAVFQD